MLLPNLMSLEEKLSNLPTQPGCYLFRDRKAKIIYVGKAKNLRNRVRQYFHTDRAQVFRTGDLIARIHDVDLIVTDNEIEALALECNLIKKHKPIFNVLLKDDKQYPHIKITNEGAPRAMIAETVCAQSSTSAKSRSIVRTAGGSGVSRTHAAVTMPRVPSEPTTYPRRS